MIVYSASKAEYRADVDTNSIGDIIHNAYQKATGRSTGRSEINSWINSLQYMDRILQDDAIPGDAGVAIEYHLPQSNKRIDFILTGRDDNDIDTAILIELKQWQTAKLTDKDAIVITQFNHGQLETPHPSYQAWSYKRLLEDFNQTVQEDEIQLYPCAYLHNYEQDDVLTNRFYEEHISNAPLFLKADAEKLRNFLKAHVKYGDKNQIMYRIDHGRIRPSKNLADNLASMLKGTQEFIMVDDQKIVYETAIKLATESTEKNKHVLIVEGGPGTGKSVVAINLLVELTKRKLVAQYVTRNSAPRLVYEAKLTNSFRRSHISNMFRGSGTYQSAKENSMDCLIVDEAHRLNERSGLFSNLGENQIMEIIKSSKCSIFFLDEDQRVTLKDIGDKTEILRWAKKLRAKAIDLTLESQFRCNGSDGYLAWLDNTLQIRGTANDTLEAIDYDFRIIDSPSDLHKLIIEKNLINNKARLVAGYCWKWISKQASHLKDIVIGDYSATWNLNSDGQAWIIKPNSVSEVGCIHTCQGLEVDYIGVIIGPDMISRDGKIMTQPDKRASEDKSIHGWKALMKQNPEAAAEHLDAIIKNTYRTLMTRGQKGCYVYFVDQELKEYVKNRMGQISQSMGSDESKSGQIIRNAEPKLESREPFQRLDIEEVMPFKNCVPIYDLKIAAGRFSDEQQVSTLLQGAETVAPDDFEWAELPDSFLPRKDLFIAQVVGESMNRRIPNGSWCLFKLLPKGTRQGKVVLVQHREINDTDTGGHFTVKIYESQKEFLPDGTWKHSKIILRPDTNAPGYEPIVLMPESGDDLRVIAELVAVLG